MYLGSNRWRMTKKPPRRPNMWRIGFLLLLIGGALYLNQFIVPRLPPPFLPTPTATRSPASFAQEAQGLFREGKLAAAADAYNRAIRVDPSNADLHIALSRVQVFSRKYTEALESAQNALLLSPQNPMAWSVYGWVLDYLPGRVDEAKRAVRRRWSAIRPRWPTPTWPKSADQGRWQDASTVARQALSAAPDDEATAPGYVARAPPTTIARSKRLAAAPFSNLATLYICRNYRALEDVNNAVDNYLRATALDPANPEPYSSIARTYAGAGQFGKAAQYAEQAVSWNMLDPRLHGLLGVMYYHNNQFEKALPELNLAIAGGTTDQGTVAGIPLDRGTIGEYYWTYGLALAKLDRCDEAVPLFRLVLAGIPDDELAAANATEGLVICKEISPTATPKPSP
jgi:tetratricopeptide (TPR) repeat protein